MKNGEENYDNIFRAAAFFGTLQAGFTDFHYLRSIWKETTEEDALIGVGITGIANGRIKSIDNFGMRLGDLRRGWSLRHAASEV